MSEIVETSQGTGKTQGKITAGLDEIGTFFSASVLSCASLKFYRWVTRRSLGYAVLFFSLFVLITSSLTTTRVMLSLVDSTRQIKDYLSSSEFPVIRIENGIASIDAEQPLYLIDENRMAVIIDTTGTIEELDPTEYDQGFLLTRDSFHVLNRTGRYQVMPLYNLQTSFNADVIVIDQATLLRWWGSLVIIFIVLAFVGILIWNGLVRFMILSFLAMVLWGVMTLMNRTSTFSKILIMGVFAFVPALYLNFLLNRMNIRIPGFLTVVNLAIWLVLLFLLEPKQASRDDQNIIPLRSWRAWIGLPWLVAAGLFAVFSWSESIWILWGLTLLTAVALIVTSYLTHPKLAEQPATQTTDETAVAHLVDDNRGEGGA